MENRQYQTDQIEKAVELVSAKRKVIIQLPTGGGKTVEFALIAKRYFYSTGKSVLILVNRQELMFQARRTVKEVANIDSHLITAGSKKYYKARIYIGMIESTIRRTHLFDNVGLVIIDECHIATFNKIHNLFLEELIMGYSATPISSSTKEPLNKYYNGLVTGPSINELIAAGYLSQNITRCPKDIVDASQFEIDKMKGDYNEVQMYTEYKKPKHVTNVIRSYHRFCKGTKTIVFNINKEHSKEVNECFISCGYNSRHLDSDSKDREEILQWFKETEDAILCNVMIATVGFDEPTIRNVILNFSTLSLVKFIQCSGRGSRKIDGKDYFNIIDMGGNCMRFGDWNDDRDWDYIFNHPAKANEGIAPVKSCPQCEGIVHASVRVCTLKLSSGEDCNYEFERTKTLEEQDIEEMIIITKGIDIEKLIGKNSRKYDYYTFLELGHDVVSNLYNIYDNPSKQKIDDAFREYYNLCIEWYDKKMSGVDGNLKSISDSAWHIKRARDNFYSLIDKLKPCITSKLNAENQLI